MRDKLVIYLSGGMRSDWQDRVKGALGYESFEYIDPRLSLGKDPKVYTALDLFSIEICDVVLCYMEPENPSGVGLAFEAGYGLGIGKQVVVVIDEFCTEYTKRYFAIVSEGATIEFSKMDEAIDYIFSLGAITI